jgi:hypothetical protein
LMEVLSHFILDLSRCCHSSTLRFFSSFCSPQCSQHASFLDCLRWNGLFPRPFADSCLLWRHVFESSPISMHARTLAHFANWNRRHDSWPCSRSVLLCLFD